MSCLMPFAVTSTSNRHIDLVVHVSSSARYTCHDVPQRYLSAHIAGNTDRKQVTNCVGGGSDCASYSWHG